MRHQGWPSGLKRLAPDEQIFLDKPDVARWDKQNCAIGRALCQPLLCRGGVGKASLATQGMAPAPPSQKGMSDASLAPQGAPPAPPSHEGMGEASLAPQGAAPAPSLQGGMGDASLAPQGMAPATPSQKGMGDASLAPQGAPLAPPSHEGMSAYRRTSTTAAADRPFDLVALPA